MIHAVFKLFLACAICSIPFKTANAQFEYLGLSGVRVNRLRLYDNYLYAATTDGVFFRESERTDTLWTRIGPPHVNTNTVLLIDRDTILVGVETTLSQDTVSVYRTTDGGAQWRPFQNGFGGDTEFKEVTNLEYFNGQSERIFATGLNVIASSTNRGLNWEVSWGLWDGFGFATQFLRIYPSNPDIIWAGGETGILSPILIRSTNSGETWDEIFPDLGGDNASYSIAIDPVNPDVIYVGTEGRIIKSMDGGQNWETVLFGTDYPYFFGLAISPSEPLLIYAAGSINTNEPQNLVLYISRNGGNDWETVVNEDLSHGGVGDLLLDRKDNFDEIFIATSRRDATTSEGVYIFRYDITGGIEKGNIIPYETSLSQNYPNPFNSSSIISYTISNPDFVRLKVYDSLGREIQTLVDEFQNAGSYSIHFDAGNLASGVYFYMLHAGSANMETKKMLLIR
jgi:hypothetical protein